VLLRDPLAGVREWPWFDTPLYLGRRVEPFFIVALGPEAQPNRPPHHVPHLNSRGRFRHGGLSSVAEMEAIVTPNLQQRLIELSTQLTESLMTAAILANEIRNIVQSQADHTARSRKAQDNPIRDLHAEHFRPLVDDSTLSLYWRDKTCSLRNTILFRLARRLARQPNQYISEDELLYSVWEGNIRSPDTIRSAIRHLRKRLMQAGMNDLAIAIHGTAGRYGLILDGRV